ncbi:sugar kinase [Actinoplanes sp. LDG1-06]|uniref:Sugar kinase n=2 Tax=Paractinoplanes ovalisporus TaxID=2810368 RepID=A0ABS2A4F0_9ACTN|nr:sugar kinase [Actinoplanes ovalisporus]
MALVSVPANGLVRGPAPIGMGGAESNVAIGLARLGTPVTWISRLGDDALGAFVRREIRAEGVTVLAAADPDAPTGLMLKELRGGKPSRVRYYRAGSASSRMTPEDIADEAVAAAEVLHVTGITLALGPGPRAAVAHAIAVARAAGTLVSLDVNHRRTLWTDIEARAVLTGLLPSVDLLFAGPEEAALLLDRPAPGVPFSDGRPAAHRADSVAKEADSATARADLAAGGSDSVTASADLVAEGSDSAMARADFAAEGVGSATAGADPGAGWDAGAELAAALAKFGPATVVVKLGALGALAFAGGEVVHGESEPRAVVDPVGAGDAFVAGYLAALGDGAAVARCLATGNEAGGRVVTVPGDWEGLPFAAELSVSAEQAEQEVIR